MSLRPFLSLFSISSPSRCTAFNHLCLLSHFPRFSFPGSSFILLLPPSPGILSQLSSLVPSSFYSASTYLTPPLASPVSLFSLSLSRLSSPNVVAALTNFIRGMAVAATAPRLNEIIHCRTCSCEIIHGTMCVCACIYGCACECVILTSATCRPLSSRSSNSSLRESRELAIFPYRPGKNGSPRPLRSRPEAINEARPRVFVKITIRR